MHGDGPLLSHGVEMVLEFLNSHGQEQGIATFPEGLVESELRFQGSETVKQWFDRCVDRFMPEGLPRWQVEENLAVFAAVSWEGYDRLIRATVNIIKTECSLQDYRAIQEADLDDPEWANLASARYYRLDYDSETLGPAGTHPLPHLHVGLDPLQPRFLLDASDSGNVVVDFLDFVYRHFYHERWYAWAGRVWERYFRQTGREESQNRFATLMRAFDASEIGFLRQHRDDLNEIAKVLRAAKDEAYPLRADPEDRRLMNFPDASPMQSGT